MNNILASCFLFGSELSLYWLSYLYTVVLYLQLKKWRHQKLVDTVVQVSNLKGQSQVNRKSQASLGNAVRPFL